MKKKIGIVSGLILLALALWVRPGLVQADNLNQAAYQTPTAQKDGRILYTVKSGDNCLSISLKTGVSQDDLKKYNNLDANCSLTIGQQLLLGLAGPTSTPTITPTSGPVVPLATPFYGYGQVCVEVYNDVNGNALHEDTESLILNAVVSLTNVDGSVSKTGETSSTSTSLCFTDIPQGSYNVSVALPEGYNSTTLMNYSLKLLAGDQTVLEFGGQVSSTAKPLTPSEGGHSSLLGLIGGVLLLIGIGMGVYVIRSRK